MQLKAIFMTLIAHIEIAERCDTIESSILLEEEQDIYCLVQGMALGKSGEKQYSLSGVQIISGRWRDTQNLKLWHDKSGFYLEFDSVHYIGSSLTRQESREWIAVKNVEFLSEFPVIKQPKEN